jgi:hypothetical protein
MIHTYLESKYWNMTPVKLQIKFAKFVFGVNKAAVNTAVFGRIRNVFSVV